MPPQPDRGDHLQLPQSWIVECLAHDGCHCLFETITRKPARMTGYPVGIERCARPLKSLHRVDQRFRSLLIEQHAGFTGDDGLQRAAAAIGDHRPS